MGTLLDLLPWYVWLVLALAIVVVVYRVFGWQWALAAAGGLLALLFYKTGREQGREAVREEVKEKDQERAIEIRDVAAEVREDAAAAAERVPAGVVRNSDGWRRD